MHGINVIGLTCLGSAIVEIDLTVDINFRLTKEALSCIKDVAKNKCGGDAANHISQVNLEMLKPIAEEIHCNLGGWIICIVTYFQRQL